MRINLAVLKSPNNRKKNNSWHRTFINQNNKKTKFTFNKWKTEQSGFMFQHLNRVKIARLGFEDLFVIHNIEKSE
jgi:hypothetical protein